MDGLGHFIPDREILAVKPIINQPVVMPYDDEPGMAILMCDLIIAIPGLFEIIVFRHLIYDSESSPFLSWAIWGHPWCASNAPQAAAHDALTRAHVTTRSEADQIWRAIAYYNPAGTSLPERTVKHTVIRAFGWNSWRRHGRAEQHEVRQYVHFHKLKQFKNIWNIK